MTSLITHYDYLTSAEIFRGTLHALTPYIFNCSFVFDGRSPSLTNYIGDSDQLKH